MWWTWQPYLCNSYGKKGEGDETEEVEGAVRGPRDCGWPIRCQEEDNGANMNKFGTELVNCILFAIVLY